MREILPWRGSKQKLLDGEQGSHPFAGAELDDVEDRVGRAVVRVMTMRRMSTGADRLWCE